MKRFWLYKPPLPTPPLLLFLLPAPPQSLLGTVGVFDQLLYIHMATAGPDTAGSFCFMVTLMQTVHFLSKWRVQFSRVNFRAMGKK